LRCAAPCGRVRKRGSGFSERVVMAALRSRHGSALADESSWASRSRGCAEKIILETQEITCAMS
jgi:hypothetical protein